MNCKFAPTPAIVAHVAVVCATVTLQLDGTYPVPWGPYVPDTTPVGPRFEPPSVTTVPPAVANAAPPVTVVSVGGAYDTMAVDITLACDPTVTIHFKFAPTPTAELHVMFVSATVTLHDVPV